MVRRFLTAEFLPRAKRLTTKAIFLTFCLSLFTFLFTTSAHAADIITSGKLITVDIGKQKLFAWDGGKVVYETKVSTGMRYTPTVKGDFSIQRKVPIQDMKGSYPPYPPYHIKNVPNVMYFYGAYAIHGTFWHNSFGRPASHGCVNVAVAASNWLYGWADAGTKVAVF